MTLADDFPNVLVVDVLDAHGRLQQRQRFDVSGNRRRFTFGRSPEADVMLDDLHVAPMHMALEIDAGGKASVSDLNTRNGLIVDGQRKFGLVGHALVDRHLKIGRTALRFHLASDGLPPEMPDANDLPAVTQRRVAWAALLAGAACLLSSFYFVWLEAPKDIVPPLLAELIAGALVAAGWIGIWSLLTRIMQGEWRWLVHAAIFLCVTAVFYLLEAVLGVIWFALEMPRIDWAETALLVLASMILVYEGLRHSSTMPRRSAALVGLCLPLAFAIPAVWMMERNKNRDVNFISANSDFYPEVFRVRGSEPLDSFFSSVPILRQNADDARKKADELDLEEGEDSEQ